MDLAPYIGAVIAVIFSTGLGFTLSYLSRRRMDLRNGLVKFKIKDIHKIIYDPEFDPMPILENMLICYLRHESSWIIEKHPIFKKYIQIEKIELRSESVQAKTRKLKATWTLTDLMADHIKDEIDKQALGRKV
jgi:hypothetical protein